MSDCSSVSIAWGIEIETIPLLLAIDAYESSEPARRFFSLLLLRARSSTLSFTSSSRRTIASLPFEIIEEILAHLHFKLRRKARRALIKNVRTCFCQRDVDDGTPYEHACGIDCSDWQVCCVPPPPEDSDDLEVQWNYRRQEQFEGQLSKTYTPEIIKILSIFDLDLVVSPKFSNRRGSSWQDGELLDVIVGIPFTSNSPRPLASLGVVTPVAFSHIDAVYGEPGDRVTTSLDRISELTTEERRRFVRFIRTLHLHDEFDWQWPRAVPKASYIELDPISTEEPKEERSKRERVKGCWLGSGEPSLEPALLLIHASLRSFD